MNKKFWGKISGFIKKNKKDVIKVSISIIVLIILYFSIKKEFKGLDVQKSFNILSNLNISDFVSIFGVGLLAVFTMVSYDYFIIKHIKAKIRPINYFRVSWISNTFNNIFNLGGFTGTGLRALLYKDKVESKEDLKYPLFTLFMATPSGLSFLAFLTAIGLLNVKDILAGNKIYVVILILLILYLPVYFFIDKIPYLKTKLLKNSNIYNTDVKFQVKMLISSAIEWTMAGVLLWVITSSVYGSVSLSNILGIFTIASIVGVLSFIPGGLGSLDAIILIEFKAIGIAPNQILAIIILFRLSYYIIPCIIGAILTFFEIFKSCKGRKENKFPLVNKVTCRFKKAWELAAKFKLIGDLAIFILSILVFFRGFTLVAHSIFQEQYPRFMIMSLQANIYLVKAAHIIGLIVGIMLMVLSKQLLSKVKKSYKLVMVLLTIAALDVFIKELDYVAFLNILIIAFALWFFRKQFYRENIPNCKKRYIIFLIITSVMMLIYALVAPEVQQFFMNNNRITEKLFLNDRSFVYNSILAFSIAWFGLIIYNIFLPKFPFKNDIKEESIDKVVDFLEKYDGNTNTHLVFLKDKNIYMTADNKVLMAYAKIKNSLVVLGDPIGDKEFFGNAILEFQNFADKYGLNTTFYRVSQDNLSIYHEYGYYFFKLGEEALVSLDTFDLKGKKKQSLRTAKNKFERSEYSFEVIYPPFSQKELYEMREVSDDWLGDRSEDRFSIGWFNIEYLQSAPAAVIRDEDKRIVAFASTMPAYDDKKYVSIDLMRFKNNSPNGVMDLLFLHMILWAQEQGYKYFSLGMAPLSNVGVSSRSHIGEKVAKFVFNYGNHWYNFKGLRNFKGKFKPDWEPKYLAYQKAASLAVTMINITKYISKPHK
ncbi:bifunctional lysylphosphatidylglycerol flippase/synthetase MprF [Haloimpatiens sp. FM7330]|uniref:bifunctional lysylphosphatidylglycerol flippase/synthetase MprF n=1 Tax=Haloimpatiens sp. FM7330 TaxID=3298610 RepID=UPI00362B7981